MAVRALRLAPVGPRPMWPGVASPESLGMMAQVRQPMGNDKDCGVCALLLAVGTLLHVPRQGNLLSPRRSDLSQGTQYWQLACRWREMGRRGQKSLFLSRVKSKENWTNLAGRISSSSFRRGGKGGGLRFLRLCTAVASEGFRQRRPRHGAARARGRQGWVCAAAHSKSNESSTGHCDLRSNSSECGVGLRCLGCSCDLLVTPKTVTRRFTTQGRSSHRAPPPPPSTSLSAPHTSSPAAQLDGPHDIV